MADKAYSNTVGSSAAEKQGTSIEEIYRNIIVQRASPVTPTLVTPKVSNDLVGPVSRIGSGNNSASFYKTPFGVVGAGGKSKATGYVPNQVVQRGTSGLPATVAFDVNSAVKAAGLSRNKAQVAELRAGVPVPGTPKAPVKVPKLVVPASTGRGIGTSQLVTRKVQTRAIDPRTGLPSYVSRIPTWFSAVTNPSPSVSRSVAPSTSSFFSNNGSVPGVPIPHGDLRSPVKPGVGSTRVNTVTVRQADGKIVPSQGIGITGIFGTPASLTSSSSANENLAAARAEQQLIRFGAKAPSTTQYFDDHLGGDYGYNTLTGNWEKKTAGGVYESVRGFPGNKGIIVKPTVLADGTILGGSGKKVLHTGLVAPTPRGPLDREALAAQSLAGAAPGQEVLPIAGILHRPRAALIPAQGQVAPRQTAVEQAVIRQEAVRMAYASHSNTVYNNPTKYGDTFAERAARAAKTQKLIDGTNYSTGGFNGSGGSGSLI
jgi:hypothetical protein